MAVTGLPRHGGDLAAAAARWGEVPGGWVDLSTGVNPWPIPLPALADRVWRRLPDAALDLDLRRAAARCFGAAGPDWVLAVPGSSAAIQALPRLRPPTTVAVVGPTYGEHAASWRAAGHSVREVESPAAAEGCTVAVVVNPNNPDGRVVPPADLAWRRDLLVVDEAFADAVPGTSVIPVLGPGMMVLRSFGKFWGLAGLRLGFVVAAPELLAPLAAALGPWPVSGPALAVGAAALADTGWAEATRPRLAAAAARLDDILVAAGLTIVGGTPLFRLAAHAEAGALWNRLGAAGILVRAFADRPTLLRFGLPDGEAAWRRLDRALRG